MATAPQETKYPSTPGETCEKKKQHCWDKGTGHNCKDRGRMCCFCCKMPDGSNPPVKEKRIRKPLPAEAEECTYETHALGEDCPGCESGRFNPWNVSDPNEAKCDLCQHEKCPTCHSCHKWTASTILLPKPTPLGDWQATFERRFDAHTIYEDPNKAQLEIRDFITNLLSQSRSQATQEAYKKGHQAGYKEGDEHGQEVGYQAGLKDDPLQLKVLKHEVCGKPYLVGGHCTCQATQEMREALRGMKQKCKYVKGTAERCITNDGCGICDKNEILSDVEALIPKE